MSYIKQITHHEAFPGLLLLVAAVLAIGLDNSPFAHLYDSLLTTPFFVGVGEWALNKPLILWINDLLMAIFFFLVGLEIKREVLEGNLSDPKAAALPLAGAIGGMIAPAFIYTFFNFNDPVAINGWAIPAATDIAFALGVLALLGKNLPVALRTFLLTLAIVDDLGAIAIIALFYTADVSLLALGLASIGILGLIVLNRMHVASRAAYLLVGGFIWVCVLKSGVHATLAGVVTAFAIPLAVGDKKRPAEALEHDLHPWVVFLILPLFAFANAGVALGGISLSSFTQPVPMGIALGLIIGKPVGILTFCWLAYKLGIAKVDSSLNWALLAGAALLAGIGFTMSLFIGMLAFSSPEMAIQIRIGVLSGSIFCGVAGYLVLRAALASQPQTQSAVTEIIRS